jgi:hypothetical protein
LDEPVKVLYILKKNFSGKIQFESGKVKSNMKNRFQTSINVQKIKMKPVHLLQQSILTILIAGSLTGCTQRSGNHVTKEINVNLTKSLSKVDGFGVNITPAQWHNGKLKPVLDMLVNDLGSTLFRFDCVGLANWLDPARRQSDGNWAEAYLDSVYRSKVFSDAWETFRYLNSKGIEPFFNVSGRIHPGLGKTGEWNTLADFDGYAEMVTGMMKCP